MTELKRLIHNNMTVSEQLSLMNHFNNTVDHAWRVNAKTGTYVDIEAKREFVEKRFGIRCTILKSPNEYIGDRLVEPRVVDEKKCLFYLISIQ